MCFASLLLTVRIFQQPVAGLAVNYCLLPASMTGMNIEDWARAERQSILLEGHFSNAYNEFRSRLKKSGQRLSTQETSALWQRAASIPAVASTELGPKTDGLEVPPPGGSGAR